MPNLISPGEIDTATLLDDYFHNHLNFNVVEDTAKIDINENLIIHKAVDNSFMYFKLTKITNELLSVIRLEKVTIYNNVYYKVNKSHSTIQQKGYGTNLYEYCLCYLELPLVSDKIQTKAGSSNLWFNLIKSKNIYFKIYKLDLEDKKLRKLNSRTSKYSIWGIEENALKKFKKGSNYEYFEDFENDFNDYTNLFEFDYPEYNSTEEKFINPQLEKFIKNGLRNKKNHKEKIKNRKTILLVGKTATNSS